MQIKLTINGRDFSFAGSLTGAQLLGELGVQPATVVVELNGAIVPRVEFLERELKSGDTLELVTIVGGG